MATTSACKTRLLGPQRSPASQSPLACALPSLGWGNSVGVSPSLSFGHPAKAQEIDARRGRSIGGGLSSEIPLASETQADKLCGLTSGTVYLGSRAFGEGAIRG